MKHDEDIIEHLVASLFISKNKQSSLKIGSYDTAAILPGDSLTMMKTRFKGSWSVKLFSFTTVAGITLRLAAPTTYVIFEPAFPYVYLPEKDFLKWQGEAATYYSK